jgi:predicted dehydrogenase
VLSQKKNLRLDVPVFNSLEEMLPHVHAVSVAVPNFLHASYCLEAVRAGKAVFLEKPMCINRRELEEMEKVLPNLKVPVHMGYRLRWNPAMMKLREQLAGVKRISCIYHMGIGWLADGKDWTRNMVQSGGGFFTIGVHSLDLVRWLADAKGEALSGLSASAGYQDDSADFPLNVRLSGTLPSGIEIVAGTDLRGNNVSELKLQVDSEKGSYPHPDLKPPALEDEVVEYRGLIHNFIRAAKQGEWEQEYIEEVFQTHRELIYAQEIVSKK